MARRTRFDKYRADELSDLISRTEGIETVLEFGTGDAIIAETILTNHQNIHLITVDSYLSFIEEGQETRRINAEHKLSKFNHRVSIWHADALMVAYLMSSRHVDMIYTDISYAPSWIKTYLPEIKKIPHGIIAGGGWDRYHARMEIEAIISNIQHANLIWWSTQANEE